MKIADLLLFHFRVLNREMDTQDEYQVDLGNLMAFDPFHHFTSIPSSRFVGIFFLYN